MAKFKSLIVVSHGRSGSTLLQGILNTAPGFIIRGENSGMFKFFETAYRKLERNQGKKFTAESTKTTHPFYGIREADPAEFLADLSRTARNMLVPAAARDQVVCYGFKEIRYPQADPAFSERMAFFRRLFPDLAIVLNTRQHEKIAQSAWFRGRKTEAVIKTLAEADEVRLQYVARNPDHAFHIRYEDVVVQAPPLRELFEAVGATYIPERVAETLATPHGSSKQGKKGAKSAEEIPEDEDEDEDEDDTEE